MKRNYLKKIEKAQADGLIGEGLGLLMTTVAHDDDCPILAGKRECNCDPIITVAGKVLDVENWQ